MKLPKLFPIALSFFITACVAVTENSLPNTDQQTNIFIQPRDEAGWDRLANFWQSVKTFVHEKKLFIAEFWKNRHQVGSFIPSSKYLAQAMTNHIQRCDQQVPLNILEVGAGTGIFTKYIIKQMHDDGFSHLPFNSAFNNSDLDVIEIDPAFFEVLTNLFGQEPNVHLLCCDITKFETKKKYDFIISGLPFHSFNPELVDKILDMYDHLIKQGGTVTFFEYIAIQTLKKPFLSDEEVDTLEDIRDLINAFKRLGKSAKESIVWRNFLPARVISVTF